MSCLFRALGRFVNLDEGTLRQRICEFQKTNPLLIDGAKLSDLVIMQTDVATDEKDPLASYIYQMSNQGVMGGAIEISCFTHMFDINVRVRNTRAQNDAVDRRKPIEFIASEATTKWIEIEWSGGHYEPIA